MSYDHPNKIVYHFPLYDYGAGTSGVNYLRGPAGKAGVLWDWGVMNIQEDFAGASSDATISVGNASDPDAYGEELTLDESVDILDGGWSVRSQYAETSAAFLALIGASGLTIPADTAVYVTSTSAAGSPTGQACPYVVIDWAW